MFDNKIYVYFIIFFFLITFGIEWFKQVNSISLIHKILNLLYLGLGRMNLMNQEDRPDEIKVYMSPRFLKKLIYKLTLIYRLTVIQI